LHPDHLVVALLALAVDPVVEAEDPEPVLLELTREVLGEEPFELVDVDQLLRGDRPRADLDVDGLTHTTHPPSGREREKTRTRARGATRCCGSATALVELVARQLAPGVVLDGQDSGHVLSQPFLTNPIKFWVNRGRATGEA